jgi:hypothetical protein
MRETGSSVFVLVASSVIFSPAFLGLRSRRLKITVRASDSVNLAIGAVGILAGWERGQHSCPVFGLVPPGF